MTLEEHLRRAADAQMEQLYADGVVEPDEVALERLQKRSKYTVMLYPRTMAALKDAARINGESRVSVVNRAVCLYRLITSLIHNGWTIVARADDGRERPIHIL